MLALLQLCVGIAAALVALAVGTPDTAQGLDRAPIRTSDGRALDTFAIGLAVLFLIGPLVLLAPGLLAIPDLPQSTFAAIGRAVAIALGAALMTTLLALPLAIGITARGRLSRGLEAIGLAPLAVSPLVLGTGLFLILRPFVAVTSWALVLAAIITGIMLIPYFLRLVIPSLADSQRRFAPLAQTLRMGRGAFVIRVLLARSRREIAEAAGLCAALAAGEMSVLALLAPPDRPSLPILVNQLIGAYRTDQALAAALVLVALSVGLYTLIAAVGRGRHA